MRPSKGDKRKTKRVARVRDKALRRVKKGEINNTVRKGRKKQGEINKKG